MLSSIGAAIGSACKALGMEFEKPPIILERENTQLETLIHKVNHDLALDTQVVLSKHPSPYETLLKGGVFPPNMGDVR